MTGAAPSGIALSDKAERRGGGRWEDGGRAVLPGKMYSMLVAMLVLVGRRAVLGREMGREMGWVRGGTVVEEVSDVVVVSAMEDGLRR